MRFAYDGVVGNLLKYYSFLSIAELHVLLRIRYNLDCIFNGEKNVKVDFKGKTIIENMQAKHHTNRRVETELGKLSREAILKVYYCDEVPDSICKSAVKLFQSWFTNMILKNGSISIPCEPVYLSGSPEVRNRGSKLLNENMLFHECRAITNSSLKVIDYLPNYSHSSPYKLIESVAEQYGIEEFLVNIKSYDTY